MKTTDLSLNRRQRWGWYLFDFANSILIINGGLYFPQWLVVDNGVSGSLFNLTVLLSSVLLIFTAPQFGARADERGECMRLLWITSIGLFLSGLVLGIGGVALQSGVLRNVLSLICFAAVLYFYQLSLVFYNALLKPLSTAAELSKVSGIGLAWGWIGGIVAVIAIDPVVKGHLFFHTANRMNAILPSTLAFGALTALSLFMIRDLEGRGSHAVNIGKRTVVGLLRELRHYPVLFAFMMAFFLYSDAILTISNNITIFMEKVFVMSDERKAAAFLAFLLVSAVAAAVEKRLTDPSRSFRVLLHCTVGWLMTIIAATFTTAEWGFHVVFVLMGILYGILFNSSRVLFFQLIPKDKVAEYFGLYCSFERFASIVGPLLWSVPLVLRAHEDSIAYRAALGMMALPIALALCLLALAQKRADKANGIGTRIAAV
ncbi:MAG: MFS transporter [Verrucomicrobia bacterium]|nr:MFS transporter [Verrucomicrobiota bacterium]